MIHLKGICFVPFPLCKFCRPFCFAEPTVTGIKYLDMLQLWLMSQLQEESEDSIVQPDEAPPHFHLDAHAHLIANLSGRWIGRTSDGLGGKLKL
jgi:hypothetical protein